jgi:hypothetical protein
MRRWVLQSGGVDVPARLSGDVTFDVDLDEEGVSAFVRNRTPYRLEEVTIIWGRIATRRLGDLPPGSQTRCRLAHAKADGLLHGVQEGVPPVYGEATGFGNSLDTYDVPLLLAHCPGGPRPTLLVDEHPVPSEALTALLVAPSGFRCRGRAFRLPDEGVTARLVRAGGWSVLAGPRVLNAGLVLEPQEWSIWELSLPPGASRGAWRRLELRLDGSLGQLSTFRLRAFDWVSEQWVPVALLRGTQSAALPSPERLIHPQAQSILVRVENASDPQSVPPAVSLRIGGGGEPR